MEHLHVCVHFELYRHTFLAQHALQSYIISCDIFHLSLVTLSCNLWSHCHIIAAVPFPNPVYSSLFELLQLCAELDKILLLDHQSSVITQ